jgi:hypothetical protein
MRPAVPAEVANLLWGPPSKGTAGRLSRRAGVSILSGLLLALYSPTYLEDVFSEVRVSGTWGAGLLVLGRYDVNLRRRLGEEGHHAGGQVPKPHPDLDRR